MPSRPGYDTVGQAMSGLLSLLTDMDRPRPMGISLSDHLAGMVACNGILGALWSRAVAPARASASTPRCWKRRCRSAARMPRAFSRTRKVPNRATRTRQAQVYAFVAGDGKPFVIHLSSPAEVLEGARPRRRPPEWLDDPRFATQGDARAQLRCAARRAEPRCSRRHAREHWLAKLHGRGRAVRPRSIRSPRCSRIRRCKHLGMRAGRAAPAARRGRTGAQRRAACRTPRSASARPRRSSASITDEILGASSTAPTS